MRTAAGGMKESRRLLMRPGRGVPGCRGRGQEGQALVELAIVLPLLVLLLLALAEGGRYISAHLSVQHAAREGVRLGVTGAKDGEIIDRVKTAAAALPPDQLDVTVSPPEGSRSRGQPLTVTVSYPFRFAFPFLFPSQGGEVPVVSTVTMRME